MKRVVCTVVVKKNREIVRVIGYSKTDRGQRFVNGGVKIDTQNLSQVELDAKVKEAVEKLLENQAGVV